MEDDSFKVCVCVCACVRAQGSFLYFFSATQLGSVVFGAWMKGTGTEGGCFPSESHCHRPFQVLCFISRVQHGCV